MSGAIYSHVGGSCQCCNSGAHRHGGKSPNVNFPPLAVEGSSAPLSKYTVSEWHQVNSNNLAQSDHRRAAGQRARHAAQRAIRDADRQAHHAQRESTQRLAERLSDVGRWRHEVLHELEQNAAETDRLESARQRTECLHRELGAPLKLVEDNRRSRQMRTGVDQVHDPVEMGLDRENSTLMHLRERLCRQLDTIAAALRELRDAKQTLERDALDKFSALNIDKHTHGLSNAATGVALYPGIERWDRTLSTPESWSDNTLRLVQRSQQARAASARLRTEADSANQCSVNEHWQAWSNTNQALASRTQQTQEAKSRIQQELSRLVQEIAEQERHRSSLRRALEKQQPHLRVAQTRLERRTHRPGRELCRDDAMIRLQGEVRELSSNVRHLQQQLSDVEHALASLLQQKHKMEEELRVKANSLLIDRDQVLGSRRAFPVTSIATKCL